MKPLTFFRNRRAALLSAALVAAILSTSGCAALFKQGPPATLEDPTKRHEGIEPTTAQGAERMSPEDARALRAMTEWHGKIWRSTRHTWRPHRKAYAARVAQKMRRFRLAIAARLGDKAQSFAMVLPMLEARYPDIQAAVRKYAPGYLAAMQRKMKERGSYRIERDRRRRDSMVGNCVLAAKPFGPEGTTNNALLFRVTTEETIHARCYLTLDRDQIPPEAVLQIKVGGYGPIVGRSGRVKGGKRYMDFEISLRNIQSRKVQARGVIVPIKLTGRWNKAGYKLHKKAFNRGYNLERNKGTFVLAKTGLFFDHPGT